ncbi:MAG TPA: hypothetical protein VKE74_13335 [Gemmataceae bacterium]|nr:hypothetical protein [Gemmataceae bacterium]
MPIVTICPYCRVGGVRAPDRAVGLSVTCPKCKSSFTVVPGEQLPGWAKPEVPAAPPPRPRPAPVDETRPHATAEDVTEPSPVLTEDPPMPAPVLAVPRRVARPAAPPPPAPPGLAGPLVAAIVFGLAILSSQFPYGRFIAPSLASLGLLIGLLGLTSEGRARMVAAAAALLNLIAIGLVFLAPGWLGLEPWRKPALPGGPQSPQAVGHGTGITAPADWVDASGASWAEGDVRITVRSATVAPIELAGPNGSKRVTKEPCLQILVRLTNEGVERRVELSGWAAGGDGAQLTDATGTALKPKRFEPGWEPAGRTRPAGLFPGKSVEVLLVFEPHPGMSPKSKDARPESLRLQLPGEAVGVPDPARFHIPVGFVTYGRVP